jgi:O-antigen/teichoic acid export membrane protein
MKKINDLLLLSSANIGGSGLTSIFWFIIAALLVPNEYGQIQYFISIAGLAYVISLLGTGEVISVYTAKKIKLQSTLILLSLITGTIASVVILFLFSKIEISFLIIGFIINDIALAYLIGNKFFGKYSKYLITQKGLTFGLGITLYFIFGVDGILFGLALSYLHFMILIFKIYKSSKINFPLLKTRLGFVTNNYWMNTVGIAKNHLDKIIVVPLIGFELLGNYALTLQVYAISMILTKIIYRYTLPHDSVGETTTKIKLFALFSSIIITILTISLAPFIMPIIFPEYVEAISAIQIISLAVIPSTVTSLLTSKLLGNENSKILLSTRIIFAVIFIGLVVALTPIYGIVGTTMGFVIASITQCIILIVYSRLK